MLAGAGGEEKGRQGHLLLPGPDDLHRLPGGHRQHRRGGQRHHRQAGLKIVPFDAGFFASIPCDNPDEISAKLEKKGIFLVPLAMGLRVSIASISEEKCRRIPAEIKRAMEE